MVTGCCSISAHNTNMHSSPTPCNEGKPNHLAGGNWGLCYSSSAIRWGNLKQLKQQRAGDVTPGTPLPQAPRFSLVPRAARMPTGLHNPEGRSLRSASLLEQEQTGFSIALWLLAASHERQVTASLKNEWLLVSGMCHFGSNLVM